ncbi:MAG: zinc ribbon domain-containing protein [Candidatus Bathyarchaeia archaeon]
MKLNSISAISISIMLLLCTFMLNTGVSLTYAQTNGSAQYFAVIYAGSLTNSSGPSYLNIDGQEVNMGGGSEGAIFCYIPALNITAVAKTYAASEVYSPSDTFPYTVDNRLFVFTRYLIDQTSGDETASIDQVPLNGNGAAGPAITSQEFSFYEPVSFAIVGNSLYFQAGMWYNEFGGKWEGNQLKAVNLTSGAETQLLSACPSNFGRLLSAGGNLFTYEFANANITINQLDLGTGEIVQGADLTLPLAPNNEAFSDWCLSADQNAFYIAAQYSPDANSSPIIYLWSIPLTEFENGNVPNGPNYWFSSAQTITTQSTNETGVGLKGIDACEGSVLLNMGTYTILYDSNTASYTTILGGKEDVSILYGVTNPEANIPTPTASLSPSASSSSSSPASTNIVIGVVIAAVIVAAAVVFLMLQNRLKARAVPTTQKVQQQPNPTQAGLTMCPKCNNRVAYNASFCTNCGADLKPKNTQ